MQGIRQLGLGRSDGRLSRRDKVRPPAARLTRIDDVKDLVPSSHLSGLLETVEALGGDPARIARQARVPPSLLDQGAAHVSLRDVESFTNTAAAELKRSDFGLLWGAQTDLWLLGPASIAWMNAPTIRVGANLIRDYLQSATTMLRFDSVNFSARDADLLSLAYQMERPSALEHGMERHIVLVLRLMRNMIGANLQPVEVLFAHPQKASDEAYTSVFGVLPSFEAGVSGLMIRSADMDRPVVNRDPALFAMAENHIIRPTGTERRDGAMVGAIRLLLQTGNDSIERISQTVGLHPRTLQRRLQDSGTSVAKLRDEIRRDRAEKLLAMSPEPITDIALTLGYSDLASFSHSCKRWFGASPTAIRLMLRARDKEVYREEISAAHSVRTQEGA